MQNKKKATTVATCITFEALFFVLLAAAIGFGFNALSGRPLLEPLLIGQDSQTGSSPQTFDTSARRVQAAAIAP